MRLGLNLGKETKHHLYTALFAGVGSVIGLWIFSEIKQKYHVGYYDVNMESLVPCIQGCLDSSAGGAPGAPPAAGGEHHEGHHMHHGGRGGHQWGHGGRGGHGGHHFGGPGGAGGAPGMPGQPGGPGSGGPGGPPFGSSGGPGGPGFAIGGQDPWCGPGGAYCYHPTATTMVEGGDY